MYVFDTSSFSTLIKFYYPKRFPTLWRFLHKLIEEKKLFSVREAYLELLTHHKDSPWLKTNQAIFHPPSPEEAEFLTKEIFTVKNGHFRHVIKKNKQLNGGHCADPFLIASAKIKQAAVITEEIKMPNSSKIPNICEHFKIPCHNLEAFMEKENLEF